MADEIDARSVRLAEIKARHTKWAAYATDPERFLCPECSTDGNLVPWPCDTAVVIAGAESASLGVDPSDDPNFTFHVESDCPSCAAHLKVKAKVYVGAVELAKAVYSDHGPIPETDWGVLRAFADYLDVLDNAADALYQRKGKSKRVEREMQDRIRQIADRLEWPDDGGMER